MIMKVRDLIALLEKQDPDRVVVMSKDPEGNGFSPLHEGEAKAYDPEEREIYLEPRELNAATRKLGFTEEDVRDDDEVVPAFVLFPA